MLCKLGQTGTVPFCPSSFLLSKMETCLHPDKKVKIKHLPVEQWEEFFVGKYGWIHPRCPKDSCKDIILNANLFEHVRMLSLSGEIRRKEGKETL